MKNIEMSLEDFKREFGSYTLEHTSNPFSKDDEINIYKGKRHIGQYLVEDKELVMYENYKGNKIMKKRMNEEERYLSDEDIAAQYEDFKCTYIEVEPSKVNEGWYNFTLELEFPNADDYTFNSYVIENGFYDSKADRWGFDNWYPEETSEKLKEMVLAEIEKVAPKAEETDIEALQRIGSKDYAIYKNNKTGEFFVDKVGAENPKPAYKKVFGSEEELKAWAKEVGLDESYKGKKTMKKRMNEDAKIIANLYNDFKPWSGAVATWEKITDADMLEDLDRLIEEMYPDGIGMTELNDLLWFEDEWVLEQLGLAETEDDEEYDESLKPSRKSSRKMNENLQQEYDEIIKRGKMPLIVIDTAEQSHEIYFEPQGDKLVFGYGTNAGIKHVWEFDYDDTQSFDWNFQGMVEEIQQELWDEEGYPVDESLKSSRKSSKAISEDTDDDEKETIWDYLVNYDIATDEEIRLVTSINGYSVETLNDIIYARTGLRDIEQLKAEYGEDMEESLDEISDETVNNALSKRNQAYNYTNKKWVDKMFDGSSKREQNKAWKEREKASTKRWNAEELAAKRKARKEAQQESLSTSLIKSAKAVLSMNESDVSEVSSWSFKAKGFSKIASNKQPTFGNSELNGTIHENLNGKISGIVMTNHAMSREEVEESLKNALMDNGFKTTVISELVNLY